MKRLLKNISKVLIVTLIFTTLLTNKNVVFCDDNKTLTITYTTNPVATFIDDLTGDTTYQEHEMGDKLIEPSHSDDTKYKFLGWYLDDTKWDFENDTINDNITLHGKYRRKIIPDIPHTGVDGIDGFIEAIETNSNFNSFILIVLIVLILIVVFILIFRNKDKDEDEKPHKKINISKTIKDIFIVVLCVMFVINPSNIHAEGDDTITVTEDGDYNIKLTATIKATEYEIVVPSEIDISEDNSFNILAKADFFLYEGNPIDNFIITVDDKVTFKKEGNDSITYDMTINNTFKESYTNIDINPMGAVEYSSLGEISYELPNIDYAGTYKGTLTFTYSLERIEDGD